LNFFRSKLLWEKQYLGVIRNQPYLSWAYQPFTGILPWHCPTDSPIYVLYIYLGIYQ